MIVIVLRVTCKERNIRSWNYLKKVLSFFSKYKIIGKNSTDIMS